MTLKKGFKKVISFALAGAMALGLAVTGGGGNVLQVEAAAPPNQDSVSQINFATILGGAVDYGIVADNMIQDGHMETTFATNKFTHISDANEVDYISRDKGAHFIIKEMDKDSSLSAPYMVLGNTTAKHLFIEGTSQAFGDYDGTMSNKSGGPNGNILFSGNLENSTVTDLIKVENENAGDNVDRLIDKIGNDEKNEWSKKLSDKAKKDSYKLPSEYIEFKNPTNPSTGGVDIKIDSDEFVNKVVYIDVTKDLLKSINSNDGALNIYKDPSTVIVFNIEDNVVKDAYGTGAMPTQHFFVHTNGQKIGSTTKPGGGNLPEGQNGSYIGSDPGVDYIVVDKQICQKIIWNIRTTNNVELNSMAGTMLVPFADVKFTGGNISGWLVAGKSVNNNKVEFHYTYGGNSSDGKGQMHFALRKGFVDKYGTKEEIEGNAEDSPTANTSIDINNGDYSFIWQECNSDFSPKTGSTPVSKDIDSSGVVKFDVLDFNNIIVDENNYTSREIKTSDDPDTTDVDETEYIYYSSEDYYYKVIEDNSKTIAGISNSSGYIEIKLTVTKDSLGHFTYKVWSRTMTEDESNPGQLKEYAHNWSSSDNTKGVDMSGVQFDLGAFYNKVNASLIVKKDVEGDYSIPDGTTEQFAIKVSGEDGNFYDLNGNVVTGDDAIIPINANGSVAFTGLPKNQKYTVSEVTDNDTYPVERTGFSCTTPSSKTVVVNDANLPTVTLTNEYNATGKILVKKVVTGDDAVADNSTFKFAVQDIGDNSSTKDKYVSGLTTGLVDSDIPVYFDVVGNDSDGTAVIKLPAGEYKIIEKENDPAFNAEKYKLTTSYSDESVTITDDDTTVHEVTITNNYEDITKAKLIISKDVVMPSGVRFSPQQNVKFNFSITYKDNEKTYYVKVNNGKAVADTDPYNNNYVQVAPGETLTLVGDCIVDGRTFNVQEITENQFYSGGNNYTWMFDPQGVHELTKTEGQGNVTVDSSTHKGSTTIKNIYDGTVDDTVSLEVKKTVNPSTISRNYSFIVKQTIDNVDKYVAEDSSGNISYVDSADDAKVYSVAANGSKTIDGLEKATYTAIEKTDADYVSVPRYSWNSSTASTNQSTVEDSADMTSDDGEVTLVNNYTELTGNVKITKVVSGEASLEVVPFTLTITGTKADNSALNGTFNTTPASTDDVTSVTFNNGTATLTVTHGSSIEITGLPVGTKIKVAETPVTGYTLQQSGADLEATVSDQEVKTIALDNKYAQQKGSLVIHKTITTVNGTRSWNDIKNALSFTVTKGTDSQTINGSDDGWNVDDTGTTATYTLTDLPTGSYTVTENNSESAETSQYTLVTSCGIASSSLNAGSTVSGVSVTSAVAGNAYFSNAYTKKTGGFNVTKTVTGDGKDADKSFPIIVTLSYTTGVSGTPGKYKINSTGTETSITENPVRISLKDGDTAYFTGLPYGSSYKVAEGDISGTTYKGYAKDEIVPSTEQIVSAETNTDITVKNTYTAEATANVTLSKKTINGTDELVGATLKVTTDAAGSNTAKDTNGDGIEWISGSTAHTVSLAPGTYYMVETTAPDGYEIAESIGFEVDNDGNVTLLDASKGEISGTTITMRDAAEGQLTVKKVETGDNDAASGKPAEGVYQFAVKQGGKYIVDKNTGKLGTTETWFDVIADSPTGTVIKGLELGVEYEVVEKTPEGITSGYTCTPSYNNGTSDVATITLSNSSKTGTVTITNTYEKAVSLKISKTVVAAGASGVNSKAFPITITIKKGTAVDTTVNGTHGDVEFTNGVASISLKNSESATIKNLPKGDVAVVEESDYENAFSGYKYLDTSKHEDTISLNSDSTCELTNNYEKIQAQVTIKKAFGPGSEITDGTYNVVIRDNSVNKDYWFIDGNGIVTNYHTNENGLCNFVINTTGRSINLPAGTYTVTEVMNQGETGTAYKDGYTLDSEVTVGTSETGTFTIDENTTDPIEVTVTNTYTKITEPTGTLTVTKTEAGDTGHGHTGNYYFTVKEDGTSNYVQNTSGGMGSSAHTFAIKPGETNKVVISNLLRDKTYVVEEVAVDETKLTERYTCTTTYTGGEGTLNNETNFDPNATTANPPATSINIVNTYSAPASGILNVTKTVEDTNAIGHGHGAEYSFKVKASKTGETDKWVQDDGSLGETAHEFTVTAGSPNVTQITDLDTSYTYTVIESDVTLTNPAEYSCAVAYSPADGVAVFDNTKTASVGITNTYTYTPAPTTASLELSKTVTTNAATDTTIDNIPEIFYVALKIHGSDPAQYIQGPTGGNLGTDIYYFEVPGDGTSITIGDLAIGTTYDIVEDEATAKSGVSVTDNTVDPAITTDNFTLTVGGDDSVLIADSGNTATVTNTYSSTAETKYDVIFSKVIAGGGQELAGAELKILDSTGTAIHSWFSDGSEKTYSLIAGTYTLTESKAPLGYDEAEDITFEVTDAGEIRVGGSSVQKVVMEDSVKKTTVTFNKVSTLGSEEIDGATLELYTIDSSGNVSATPFETWISDTKNIKQFSLTAGDYAIKETVAPDGYKKSEQLVKFSVYYDSNNDAQIKLLEGPGTVDSSDKKVSFKDDPIQIYGKLSVHVEEEKTGRPVPDAIVEVEGPDGKKVRYTTNSNGEITDKVDGKGVTPFDVPVGKYKVTILQVPEGFDVTVGETAEVTVPKNGEGRHIAKILPNTGGLKVQVLEEGTRREVPDATVEIEAPAGTTFPDGSTKITAITDKNGWITSYKDADGNVIDLTTGLTPGDYKITVVKVPEGYKVTTGKTETVTVVKGEVATHEALIATGASAATPTKTTTPATTTTAAKSVDTGDHTNVIPFIIMMIVSLISSIVVIIRKRRLRYEY